MKTKKGNLIIVTIKKPSSSFVMGLIKEFRLNTNKKLLDNIEKIIPISKILKNEEFNKLANVTYYYDYKNEEVKMKLHLQ